MQQPYLLTWEDVIHSESLSLMSVYFCVTLEHILRLSWSKTLYNVAVSRGKRYLDAFIGSWQLAQSFMPTNALNPKASIFVKEDKATFNQQS